MNRRALLSTVAPLCALFLAGAVSGCTVPSSSTTITVLSQIANTGTADLNGAVAVANAATPPDLDGAQCAQGILTVGAAIKKTASALPAGTTVGVFTVGEVASLYQPGSAQFVWATNMLGSSCFAKVADVRHAALSTDAIIAALPALFQLAPIVAVP